MSLPSGTFHEASAGQLEVIFIGTFQSSTTSDAGFPGAGGTSEIVIKCTVNNGTSDIGVAYIRFSSPTAVMIFNYPGGNVNWTVSMTDVYHAIGGLGSVSCLNPEIDCVLIVK